MSSSSPDLVIVGAGAAGLSAARAARESGIEAVVLEAMPRIGGRAYTDTQTFGVPWDRGCHWLHSAGINPFTQLADAYGFLYRREPSDWRIYRDGRWLTGAEGEAIEAAIDDVLARAMEAGRRGEDRTLAAFAGGNGPWVRTLEAMIHAEWGFGLDQISTLDMSRYRDTDTNWPVREGFGALVARHGAEIDVTLSSPVTRIEWGGKRPVVHSSAGRLDPAAVLVTVSPGVLAAEAIEFDPPLPEWKRDAIAAVPLGRDNKAAIQLRGGLPGFDGQFSAEIPFDNSRGIYASVHPFGTDLVSVYLGGSVADDLEEVGEREAIAAVVDAIVAVFGSEVRARIGASTITAWGKDPFVRGAYSGARPGLAHLRSDLGTSLDDRIFFAGEATSPEFFTTCHGAHLSGIAAVAAIRDKGHGIPCRPRLKASG